MPYKTRPPKVEVVPLQFDVRSSAVKPQLFPGAKPLPSRYLQLLATAVSISSVFPDLMSLQGDAGGRLVFSRYPVTYIPWNDPRLLLDVDTLEDYERLLKSDR
jgi:hypothetical protein